MRAPATVLRTPFPTSLPMSPPAKAPVGQVSHVVRGEQARTNDRTECTSSQAGIRHLKVLLHHATDIFVPLYTFRTAIS